MWRYLKKEIMGRTFMKSFIFRSNS